MCMSKGRRGGGGVHVISRLGFGSVSFSAGVYFGWSAPVNICHPFFKGDCFLFFGLWWLGYTSGQTTCQGRRGVVGTGISLISGIRIKTKNTVLSLCREDGASVQKTLAQVEQCTRLWEPLAKKVMHWWKLEQRKIKSEGWCFFRQPLHERQERCSENIGKWKRSNVSRPATFTREWQVQSPGLRKK